MRSNQYAIDRFRKGKAGKGSALWSAGDKLFSYGTGILQSIPDGRLIGNITKYSRTTSRHQSQAGVRSACFLVDNVPRGTTDLVPYLKDGEK